MWVALLKGEVVGIASVVPQGEALYVRSMAILPAARGNRIGEKLLTQIETFAIANRTIGRRLRSRVQPPRSPARTALGFFRPTKIFALRSGGDA